MPEIYLDYFVLFILLLHIFVFPTKPHSKLKQWLIYTRITNDYAIILLENRCQFSTRIHLPQTGSGNRATAAAAQWSSKVTISSLTRYCFQSLICKMNEADPLYSSNIVNCVFNGFSAYSAIALNILTIHAIRKTSASLPKPLKTLLVSLAVSDLGVGLLVQPLQIASLISRSCIPLNVLNAITFVFIYTSFFTVVAISIDRFLAIHLHLRYQEFVTPERVLAVVILIWVLGPFLSSMWLWIPYNTTKRVYITIGGLCFICGAIVYCRIYLVVRRHANQIQVLQVQQELQNTEMTNVAGRRKSAVSTFYVYLVFLVCYLPIYCLGIVDMFSAVSKRSDPHLYLQTLMLLNSSLNPVIYCWKMRHIRHTILETLRNLFPSQNWRKLW